MILDPDLFELTLRQSLRLFVHSTTPSLLYLYICPCSFTLTPNKLHEYFDCVLQQLTYEIVLKKTPEKQTNVCAHLIFKERNKDIPIILVSDVSS
jgi:hypothetical protein